MRSRITASALATAAVIAAAGVAAPSAQAQQAPAQAPSLIHPTATGALLSVGYLARQGNQLIDTTGKPERIAAVALHGMGDLDQTAILNQDSPLAGLDANMQAIRNAGFNTVTLQWNDASLHDANAANYLAGIDAVVNEATKYNPSRLSSTTTTTKASPATATASPSRATACGTTADPAPTAPTAAAPPAPSPRPRSWPTGKNSLPDMPGTPPSSASTSTTSRWPTAATAPGATAESTTSTPCTPTSATPSSPSTPVC